MYPGVGPDGVYRLHSGLYKSNNPLPEQLHEGGRKLDGSVGHRMKFLRFLGDHELRVASIKNWLYG